MPRYVAFLRGVSPQNCKMPELKAALERAGFANVRTILSSGNAAFDSALGDASSIEAQAEAAMATHLGKVFYPIVRSVAQLELLLASDPYAEHGTPPEAKRVVSFFRTAPTPKQPLPLAQSMASLFLLRDREAFTAYVPVPEGPVFMTLIEKAFGKQVTTRTLDTIAKCAKA